MKPEIEYVYNKLKQLRFDFNSIDFRDFRSEYRYEPTLDRYVRKDDNDLFIAKDTFKPLEEELEYADKCHNLEEELGCPLEVIFKALKEGAYLELIGTKLSNNNMVYHKNISFNKEEITFQRTDESCIYINRRLKDYKKTWWLKEDRSE